MILIKYFYFVDVSRAVIVSNNFSATAILFDPKLQEVFNLNSKLPSDDFVISKEDFDPKSIYFKIDLYDEFFPLRIH